MKTLIMNISSISAHPSVKSLFRWAPMSIFLLWNTSVFAAPVINVDHEIEGGNGKVEQISENSLQAGSGTDNKNLHELKGFKSLKGLSSLNALQHLRFDFNFNFSALKGLQKLKYSK